MSFTKALGTALLAGQVWTTAGEPINAEQDRAAQAAHAQAIAQEQREAEERAREEARRRI